MGRRAWCAYSVSCDPHQVSRNRTNNEGFVKGQTHVSPTVIKLTGKHFSFLSRDIQGTPQCLKGNPGLLLCLRRPQAAAGFSVLSKKWKEYLDFKQQLCKSEMGGHLCTV